MKNKQEAKQLVRFPYCRIYRRFINHLEHDIRIRKHGQGILYRYIALFALANFRCGVRTLNGQRYVMQAGEWIASYQELCKRLCLHTQKQVINTLCRLEELGLIEAQVDSRHKLVRTHAADRAGSVNKIFYCIKGVALAFKINIVRKFNR